MRKNIEVRAGYDLRHLQKGRSPARIVFTLVKPNGGICFVADTGWWREGSFDSLPQEMLMPYGLELSVHSFKPLYEGHDKSGQECPVIGGKCYMQHLDLRAQEALKILIEEGSDSLFKFMDKQLNGIIHA